MLPLNDYIKKNTVSFNLEIKFSEVVDFLNSNNLTHFPVIQNDIFLGNLSLIDAETFLESDEITNAHNLFEVFFVREKSFWFEILEVFSKNHANIVPVLSSENKFIGYYKFDDVIHFLNETPFLKESGTTIIVEKSFYDYSLSQISQIIEVNNAKILGLIVGEVKNNIIQIIIKTTTVNINEIIQSLRRFEYEVISEHIEDQFLSDLKDRSAYLDKYLNI